MVKILLKRIYEEPSEADGYRILLDRLWPRGLKKEDAKFDEWRKDITPSRSDLGILPNACLYPRGTIGVTP